MKLLFDQNISYRIVKQIISIFPNSTQVRDLGIENYSDIEIWKYAKSNNFSIVTFDTDFADIASIKGCPPKIIWLRMGNMSTKSITEILIKHKEVLIIFIESPDFKEIACLEIE